MFSLYERCWQVAKRDCLKLKKDIKGQGQKCISTLNTSEVADKCQAVMVECEFRTVLRVHQIIIMRNLLLYLRFAKRQQTA